MLTTNMPPKKYGDAELAYNILGKATFGAILYAVIFLMIAIQPLWYQPSALPPPMSPPVAAVTMVLNGGLLLLPALILFLFSFGYYGLVHKAMLGLRPDVRESVWKARMWFRIFWLLIGLAVLFLAGSIGATAIGAPQAVRLAAYLPFATVPSALLVAFVLFLGYAVWAPLPAPRRIFLQRLVWTETIVVSAAAAGAAVLTALAWGEIEASGVIAPAYSPWTTIPSGALTVGTLIALYLALRWVQRHVPLREPPEAGPGRHPDVAAAKD